MKTKLRGFAITLALIAGISSAAHAATIKKTGPQCFWAVGTDRGAAYRACGKAIGGTNCKEPTGGCNVYEWQWGAIAAGLRHNPDFVAIGTHIHGQAAKEAESKALAACSSGAQTRGFSCAIVHVWTRGCGYISWGCIPAGGKN